MNKKEALECVVLLENYTNFLTLTRKEHILIVENLEKLKAFINSSDDKIDKK